VRKESYKETLLFRKVNAVAEYSKRRVGFPRLYCILMALLHLGSHANSKKQQGKTTGTNCLVLFVGAFRERVESNIYISSHATQ
jgi:hypothetical protein